MLGVYYCAAMTLTRAVLPDARDDGSRPTSGRLLVRCVIRCGSRSSSNGRVAHAANAGRPSAPGASDALVPTDNRIPSTNQSDTQSAPGLFVRGCLDGAHSHGLRTF